MKKLQVLSFTLAGGAYRNGFRFPGWTALHLDNGSSFYGPEEMSLYQLMQSAEKQGLYQDARTLPIDCTRFRERLAVWVKTGVMPPP